jgi:hypothetical protein
VGSLSGSQWISGDPGRNRRRLKRRESSFNMRVFYNKIW